jgi:nitrogen fixation protein NifU and related proteins
MYSDTIWQHAKNPKYRGTLENFDTHTESRFPRCGDHFELFLKLEEGRISEARFQARACHPVVAMGSLGCGLLPGLTPLEAVQLRPTQLDELLGGLPLSKRHAILLFLEALHQALLPYLPSLEEIGEP